MKYIITSLVIFFLLIGGVYLYLSLTADPDAIHDTDEEDEMIDEDEDDEETEEEEEIDDESNDEPREVIGTSVDGRDIVAHHFGNGERELLLVSGVHGGYSWNTSLLAYELIDELEEGNIVIPDGIRVTVIPALNPDGLHSVTGVEGRFSAADVSGDTRAARFNAREVDINRNFACNWEPTAVWQDTEVDPGTEPFSEPESSALREYVENEDPYAAVLYYAAAGSVYSSACNGNVLPATTELMQTYADASGYSGEGLFDAYTVSGGAVNWLASQRIPAISVLLSDRENTERDMNVRAIEALLDIIQRAQ